MVKEVFDPIPGFDNYFVSNLGRVKFKRKLKQGEISERFLTIDPGKATVRITIKGVSKSFTVARLVAEAFLPDSSDGRKRVVHIDGNELNNVISNLKWSGLTRNDVREIRDKYEEGYSLAELAREYDSNSSHIRRIVERKVWKEVP